MQFCTFYIANENGKKKFLILGKKPFPNCIRVCFAADLYELIQSATNVSENRSQRLLQRQKT